MIKKKNPKSGLVTKTHNTCSKMEKVINKPYDKSARSSDTSKKVGSTSKSSALNLDGVLNTTSSNSGDFFSTSSFVAITILNATIAEISKSSEMCVDPSEDVIHKKEQESLLI